MVVEVKKKNTMNRQEERLSCPTGAARILATARVQPNNGMDGPDAFVLAFVLLGVCTRIVYMGYEIRLRRKLGPPHFVVSRARMRVPSPTPAHDHFVDHHGNTNRSHVVLLRSS